MLILGFFHQKPQIGKGPKKIAEICSLSLDLAVYFRQHGGSLPGDQWVCVPAVLCSGNPGTPVLRPGLGSPEPHAPPNPHPHLQGDTGAG